MALDEDFAAAQQKVKGLRQTPSNDELLSLYALYKQATSGDASGKRPGMLDLKGRAKFDAWSQVKGTASGDAKKKYVDLVADLAKRYG
jgi:diazepam-binding inhibitor (GABA receptor modulator, acyl-CoA-binding protein)